VGHFCAGSERPPVSVRPNERQDLVVLARPAFLNRDPHLANMSIDSRRLTKDCESAQAALAARGHVLRRTGATAVIEPILPLIRELRTQKHSWSAIAAALSAQGVVQGTDRKSISARRLTALISAINKRVRRQQKRSAERTKRRDLAPSQASAHTLSLSTDLQQMDAEADIATESEETIRRQEFEDRVRSLLKKDPI
jgi:hypothetical protein